MGEKFVLALTKHIIHANPTYNVANTLTSLVYSKVFQVINHTYGFHGA